MTAALFSPDLIRRYDRQGPRYTSYPSADHFESPFDPARAHQALAQRDPARDLSLYFHIPFCKTLCFYCGCHRIPTRRTDRGRVYVDHLIRELQVVSASLIGRRLVRQIHFGGGTPTFLQEDDLTRLMAVVHDLFDVTANAQCGIEVDPRAVDGDRIAHLASLGFNRLSVGVQDFDPLVQRAIHRVQSREETFAVLAAARAHGFKSVSVDLIYGLPHQTRERFAATLAAVTAERPDRVVVYNYAHLPERFPAQARMPADALPSGEAKLALLGQTIATLTLAGYEYIGMDHFALATDELARARRNGTLQRNFQGYSTHGDCDLLGFGVSAIGAVGGTFLQNHKDLQAWETAVLAGQLPVQRGLVQTAEDRRRGRLIQSLMCQEVTDGAAVTGLTGAAFWHWCADSIPALEALQADGLIALEGEQIRVLPPGQLLIRHIAMAFDAHLQAGPGARYSKVI